MIRTLLLVSFLYFAVTCPDAKAQIVNVQDLFLSQSNPGLHFGAVGKTEVKTGNTDYQYYNLVLSSRFVQGRHTLVGTGNIEYAEKGEDKFTNRHFEHVRYRFEAFSPFGLDMFAQHEFNEFRRMNLRLLFGIGPTWKALDSSRVYLFVGSVYMYELNELSTGEHDDSGEVWKSHRWNNYVTLQWIPKKDIKFLSTVYYQPAFSDPSNYNLLWSANLSVSINKWVAVVLTYNFSRQNVPPQGVSPWDSSLVAGITLKAGPFFGRDKTK